MTPTALRLIAALIAAGLGLPAAAGAADPPVLDAAPGRIVMQVDDGRLLHRTGGTGGGIQPTVGISHAVPLPGGSTLLLGNGTAGYQVLYAAKIGPGGALDRSFGADGLRVMDAPGGASFSTAAVLPQADGKLLFVVDGGRDMQVMRFSADLTLDRSYGVDGVARTALSCGPCVARQQPDGALVLLGAAPFVTLPATPQRPSGVTQPWALTRLTPSGAVDTGFGTFGVATIPLDGYATGVGLAFGPGGTIVTSGTFSASYAEASKLLLTRLTSSGALDPAFAGGTPVEVPGLTTGGSIVMQPDGGLLVSGAPPWTPPSAQPSTRLARYTASGTIDPGYGTGGFADLGTAAVAQILPGEGRSVILVERMDRLVGHGLRVRTVTPSGTIDPAQTRNLDLAFGGGSAGTLRYPPVTPPSVFQNGFDGTLVRRADGSYLVAGAVAIGVQGAAMGRYAVAALTPRFEPDRSFGAAARPLGLSVALVRQSTRRVRIRHTIFVDMRASAIGLAQIRVTHGSRAIANDLLPILSTNRTRVAVQLTNYGYRFLRNHRTLRVVVRALGRDLLTNTAARTARGRLR